MIDPNGYRPGVVMIISNDQGQLLWARRVGQNAWQFPQGGMKRDETPEEAMYRELFEEVGLQKEDVSIIASTSRWLRYRLPRPMVRHYARPVCIGQKQKWFLLKLESNENRINFNTTEKPEFDKWCWVNYWQPLKEVIAFKRKVYRLALEEFAPILRPSEPAPENLF